MLDQGAGFDPTGWRHARAGDPARLQHEHGLGLPLMRVLADEAEISSGEAGTAVRLVVYRLHGRRRPATPRPTIRRRRAS